MLGRKTLRLTALTFAALFALAPVSGQALPTPGGLPLPSNGNVIEAAVKCGPHAHYVRGHRDQKSHEWIKGRCIRDPRH
jgi:hypothetical protein